jgi:hypothetical protein
MSDGEYFDPALTIPLCIRHHAAEHVLLRRLGLDWPEAGTCSFDHRLRRLAVEFGRSADLGRAFVLSPASARGAQALVIEAAEILGVAT